MSCISGFVVLVYLSLLTHYACANNQSISFGRRKCSPVDELECDDKTCVHKIQWCDAVVDCPDKSDEKYCNGEMSCQSNHFRCLNGKCVPLMAVCDGFDDCHDKSDESEKNCHVLSDDSWYDEIESGATTKSPAGDFKTLMEEHRNASNISVSNAVQYLLKARDSDYSWGSFTPRAVVALSMAAKQSYVASKDMQLMQKRLNIQLLQKLMEEKENISMATLALYINALQATCQDPHNFQGLDLVSRLRSKINLSIRSNDSIPAVSFITLCLCNKTKEKDYYELANMYLNEHKPGSRALIVLAMNCIMRKDNTLIFENYVRDFFSREMVKVKNVDIYSRALLMQASNAFGSRSSVELMKEQQPDGSFGDILATYSAIPVLLDSSLIELKCDKTRNQGILENGMVSIDGENEVVYSIWISSGKDFDSTSLTVKFDGKKTFFDLMKMAAAKNRMYRFSYDESSNGKMVYSLAGMDNDVESGRSWGLYLGHVDTVKVNSVEALEKLELGVEKIWPTDKDHFVFWLKRS